MSVEQLRLIEAQEIYSIPTTDLLELPSGVLDQIQPKSSVLFLGYLLCFLQAADGILTSIGVSRFGLQAEGNPLLRVLMEQWGAIPTLLVVKFCAILVVFALMTFAEHLTWIRASLAAMSGIYLFVAVLPWSYFLFIKPLLFA